VCVCVCVCVNSKKTALGNKSHSANVLQQVWALSSHFNYLAISGTVDHSFEEN
jgi:hypothetical protein